MADSNKPKYPPGFRFVPKDEELIIYYLQLKIDNQPIPVDEITEVDLYANNPKVLAEECPSLGENEWYFFTPRERKYRNGLRPKRSAENGYWKATGSDKPILFETRTVGYKKSLVFYQGLPQKGTKTDWIMHEFRLNRPPRTRTNASDMKLDDWVLCRIYKKASKTNNNNNNNSSGLAIVPPAESDHVTTPDQVDPMATVASTDDLIAPVYESSLQVFEEQGQQAEVQVFEEQGQQAEVQGFEEQRQLHVAPLQTFEQVAPLQGFEQEPLMPLVAPPNHYHYCNDTQLADNIGFDEGFSDSWYENLTLEPLALSENKYRHNGYGIEQAAYWPQNDRNWSLVTHNDGDFTSLSQSNNGTTFSSSSSASVQSYGSYCCYIENQVSSYVPQLGANCSLVDSSMKSKAPPLINPPDHNQPRPRKRVHI